MPRRDYQDKLNADNVAVLERSRSVRDIAPDYPAPGDLALRGGCERDFRRFCEAYFPNAFSLPWSQDHLKVISRMEGVILDGGLFALAMPRGSGKTTLTVRAGLWALLYGHRRFVCLIASTEEKAKKLLKHFKTELTYNDALARDFRQVCYPIRRLENNGRKAIGQLFNGQRTSIEWGAEWLTFPLVPDSACDGVNVGGHVVSVAGLTGALRGQSHTLPSGVIIRPEVAILDDPQTRESAMSTAQSHDRADIVNGDVLGMAGPGQDIAAIMPCTVIRTGDMADTLLDREKNPEWSGQLTKMVYAFPKDGKLWDDYRRIRDEGLTAGRGGGEATAFYAANRAEMDAGAVVAWPERFKKDELSAVQHAMNLRFRDERMFFAEYQNEPLAEEHAGADQLTPEAVMDHVNRMPRGAVPAASNRLTAFVDVHAAVLYYCVCAWEDDFTGAVVDYGTFPDQGRSYFTLRDANATLAAATNAPDLEGQIYQGLDALTAALLSHEWPRDDGASVRVERLLIDANWGQSTSTIKKFCRQSAHAAVLTPSHGLFVGANRTPMGQWPRREGERAGQNWRLRTMQDSRGVRSLVFDTNWWKTFVATRLAVPMGSRTCLSLFGDKPQAHRLFADHLCAEYFVPTHGQGRRVDVWDHRPEHFDNHWLDCLVGCAVAASLQGVTLADPKGEQPERTKRVSFAELQRRKRA